MTDSPDSTDSTVDAASCSDVFPVELTIQDHYARKSQFLLANLPATFGRADTDNVRLADPWISHSHCEVFQQGGTLVVRDLDSKNGVFMHGLRVREAVVLPGDCLTLGRTEVTVRYRRPTAALDSAATSTASLPVVPAAAARQPGSRGPATEELLY